MHLFFPVWIPVEEFWGEIINNGLLSVPTFTPVKHFVCVGRSRIPNSADVSTASETACWLSEKKKSWIIRCVWLFIRAHPNNDIPWNKHWCYIQYVFLCFMFSLYCSWWNIIPFAPQRVLLSQVMMIAHYLGCSFTLWNRIFKAAFFPRCCQLAAGGHVSCCQRNPDSSSEFGSGASKLFPAAFHPHWMWSLEFFSDWRIL